MQIYKVQFDVLNKEDDSEGRGWYYFEDSVQDVVDYIKELYDDEGIEVSNLQVMMVQAPGWTPVQIERSTDS